MDFVLCRGQTVLSPDFLAADAAAQLALKRKLSFSVWRMRQCWLDRSSMALVIFASPKTVAHSLTLILVVISALVRSKSLLSRRNRRSPSCQSSTGVGREYGRGAPYRAAGDATGAGAFTHGARVLTRPSGGTDVCMSAHHNTRQYSEISRIILPRRTSPPFLAPRSLP